jgi:hypothetical protein
MLACEIFMCYVAAKLESRRCACELNAAFAARYQCILPPRQRPAYIFGQFGRVCADIGYHLTIRLAVCVLENSIFGDSLHTVKAVWRTATPAWYMRWSRLVTTSKI